MQRRLPAARARTSRSSTPRPASRQIDQLEDERHLRARPRSSASVTAPDSNRKILEEIKKYADEHETATGRFPKTLIFAVNDLPHTSHADQLVDLARDVFGRGDAFVAQDHRHGRGPTAPAHPRVPQPPEPGIVVTVDLLTTGVDIPDLEFIVFLRPVKSRILFEQMLGRGTRKGEQYPDKDHFTVFDCFDGTLLAYFRDSTGHHEEEPAPADANDRGDHRRHLGEPGPRLQHRLPREAAPADRQGDGRRGARACSRPSSPTATSRGSPAASPAPSRSDFVGTMKLLRE